MFIGLHRHSHYSKRDAIAKIPDIVNRIGELGQTAWALTDHGTTSGLMEGYKATKAYNKEHGTDIKFIFGIEAYWIPNYYIKDRKASCHLILLAQNNIGYKNILKLSTIGYGNKGANPENYFYTMRLTTEDIAKHKEGLIITSACMGGILNPTSIDSTEWDKNLAYDRAREFQSIFGDNFYLEIQCATDKRQIEYNKRIMKMSSDLGIPVIVTEDSHYVNKNEAETHRRWLGIELDPENENAYYQNDDYYIHSENEVLEKISYIPNAQELIDNTFRLANKCESVELEFGVNHYPTMDIPEGETPLSQMCKIVAKGWKEKIENKIPLDQQQRYKDQIDHEIHVLDKIDYTNYMLLTEDFIRGCHNLGIRTGIGRGSVGGSLVAYLMDITRIDPLKYNLVFERFAHDKRNSTADIDTDVPNTRRNEAIQYLIDKYHEVFHVRTFSYMGEKAAIQRAARSLGYTPQAIRHLPKSKENLQDETLKDLTTKYEGVIQAYGCHASAIMLFPSDATEWCAIEKQGDDYVCAYEYHDLEALGLLKEDVLGIKTLDAIDECCKLVKKNYGIDLDLDNLPDEDKLTTDMLLNDDVLGCFQIESGGMRKIIQNIKPKSIFDIVPLVALYRPSTIQSGMVDEFTNRRNGAKFEYIHERLSEVLKDTYGVLLYQEQAMQIVQAIAGYDLGKADVFRRAIGRKIPEVMAKLIPQFVKDGEANGVDESTMNKLAEWLTNAAAYQFNKSHSAAYGFTCWQTAYLKAHYPMEYLCAYLNAYTGDSQEDLLPYIHDVREHNIDIIPPDIRANTCKWEIVTKDNKKYLRTAINYIYGVGDIPVPVENLWKLPKNKVENLIKAGACDHLGSRQTLLETLYTSGQIAKLDKQMATANERKEKYQEIKNNAKEGSKKYQEADTKITKYGKQYWDIYEKKDKIMKTVNHDYNITAGEIEVLGMNFVDVFKNYDTSKFQEPDFEDESDRIVLGIVRHIKHWQQKNGKPMMFFTLETPSKKSYDLVMFNSVYYPLEMNNVYMMTLQGNKLKRVLS